jgi:hypothetical protein
VSSLDSWCRLRYWLLNSGYSMSDELYYLQTPRSRRLLVPYLKATLPGALRCTLGVWVGSGAAVSAASTDSRCTARTGAWCLDPTPARVKVTCFPIPVGQYGLRLPNSFRIPPHLNRGFRQEHDETMHQATTFLRLWPRTSAALGFGAAGMALSTLWWSPVIFHARGTLPFVLFIVLPGVSAAAAGWALGKPLLNPARVRRPGIAALWGATIASVSLLLFAPLFATLYVWTSPPTEHWNIVGLTFLVLVGSAVAVWWLVAATGAAVGWALFRLASYHAGRTLA